MFRHRDFQLAILISFLFLIIYLILSLITHLHFLSGYDLAIVNQYTYEWSHLKIPISTISAYPFLPFYTDHIEIIFLLLSPFYLIFSNAITLLFLQAFFLAFSGIPVFLLCKKYKINLFLSLVLLISYLSFYGMQFAVYYDAHSLVFAASLLAFFIYFLDKNSKWSVLFFILAILSKEDVALLTFLISLVIFITKRNKLSLYFLLISVVYLLLIFSVLFPHLNSGFGPEKQKYINFDVRNFVNTNSKMEVITYSLGWFGFLPLLLPLYLIPFLGDLFHYFVLGNAVNTAQGFYYHYRVTISILLVYPTILAISKYKKINNKYLGIYLLFCAFLFTYLIHAPFTYLSKEWFWTEPLPVKNINKILTYLPKDASVVSQNNITSHISNRDKIFTLWPEKKSFEGNSPCGKPICNWFRWVGSPNYLIVDKSANWDIRQLLANRDEYVNGLSNLEKANVITKYKQIGNAILYKILKQP